jgi:hypothetical protein
VKPSHKFSPLGNQGAFFERLTMELDISDFIGEDDPREETYRLALESIQRWLWRTDDLEPMDVIRQTRKVVATALRNS